MTDQAELTRPATSAKKLQTINPATGEPGKAYDVATGDDAKAAAKAARTAFLQWRRTSFAERSVVLHKAAEILRVRKDEFALLMTEKYYSLIICRKIM